MCCKEVCPLMQDPKQLDLSPDEPLCVCGYSKIGLPETDHPCPECGSVLLAAYQSSYSYYGWNVALLGAGIAFVHSLFVLVSIDMGLEPPEILFFAPWLFICVPLGGLSLLYAVISVVKREPKRKSVRNVGMALLSALLFPVGGFIALLIYVAGGGMWTV